MFPLDRDQTSEDNYFPSDGDVRRECRSIVVASRSARSKSHAAAPLEHSSAMLWSALLIIR